MSTLEHVLRVSGASARQLDHWRTRGYLKPEGKGGCGTSFRWSADEVRAAVAMTRLVAAGITPAAAARAVRNDGELAPGIVVTIAGLSW